MGGDPHDFALRYTHLYYTDPVGGVNFKNPDEPPDYRDFAYMAFTDRDDLPGVRLRHHPRKIRRHAVLRHALLAFFFGTVILATTVNLIAGLLEAEQVGA